MNPKTVGLIVLEEMAAPDLTGPAEVLSRATIGRRDHGNARESRCYQVMTIGAGAEPRLTECGISIRPQIELENAPLLDTVLICGSAGVHGDKFNKRISKWLKQRASNTRRIAALGKGIYALAASGLLDGRQTVIHWRFANDVASRFPKLRINPDHLFVKDGPFYTCAGGASAVDFALALVEEDYGRRVALDLARELVVPVKRSGENEQYSEALKFQVQSSDRFADLPAWILSHLSDDLSIDVLAQRAAMSRRNFTRLFHEVFGKTPAQFVAEARIAEARQRLLVPRNTIESVASSLGFRSADVFSVAFQRFTGIRPRIYRALRRAPKTGRSSTHVHDHKSAGRGRSTALRAA
ncbi:MAG TPA: helix-turn-helix domain-containing protein [Candidatus Udaeobacter sp.]|nr:helix-turn-helix domain-containing protein [Candidatus Udaeobacter sp.]